MSYQHSSQFPSIIHQMSLFDFRCGCSSTTSQPPRATALKMTKTDLMYTMSQGVYSSLFAIQATPQTLDGECIFISSSMHIHGQVDGACGGMRMSFQHRAECRSRRRMLIQLYGSCSLVPMATVFALEQKSCIRSLAIKDHCQA